MRMEIYTIAGSGEGWSLEVVDQDGGSICSPPTERPMPSLPKLWRRKAFVHLPEVRRDGRTSHLGRRGGLAVGGLTHR
jgi:hypothetical protein